MSFMAPALAGETDAPRRHSLIQRPVSPASPVVAHPESSVQPSRPIAAAPPSATTPSSQTLHPHKLMKKPVPPAAVAPLVSESTSAPRTSSRLSSAGTLPPPVAPTGSGITSQNIPAAGSDRPIVPIAPIPLSMSSHGAVATPASSRSLVAAAPSTAAAGSVPTSAGLSPSMTRLMQMNPGFAALLQPSTPVVTSPSNTPPSATPPSSPPPVSSTGSVTLSWSANSESDLAGYRIYFGTSSGEYNAPGSPTIIGNTTSYTVTGLQRNTTYFFALSAYDSAGNESALSAEVSRSIL
jgi:Fibronectin type III domain